MTRSRVKRKRELETSEKSLKTIIFLSFLASRFHDVST